MKHAFRELSEHLLVSLCRLTDCMAVSSFLKTLENKNA